MVRVKLMRIRVDETNVGGGGANEGVISEANEGGR